jgi:hypothetical protein
MQWTWRTVFLLALICGAAVESAIELCFSNVLVLLLLTLALGGETRYQALASGWSRWSEQLWCMIKTPGRWFWLVLEIAKRTRGIEPVTPGSWRKVARAVWIVVPGLVATLIFAAILSQGNVLFAKLTENWVAAIGDWILGLHISIWRCAFWAFVAWVSLPLLRPSPAPDRDRIWTKELPRLPELTTTATARMQSAVTLGLLSALFCCVNTIDAVYLWSRQRLPGDVSYSAFVHKGVASLIVAVLFSAILLTGMFQQAPAVSGWKPLRTLGLLWIAQNLLLLAGVLLRVKLYVDALDLTVTRVNLVFFLALVAVGFLLLAIQLWAQRTLGWLLHANMLATFFLFYIVQFLDTAGFVAQYNVNLWQNARDTRILDLTYLESLGPPAFDALQTVARTDTPQIARKAAASKALEDQAAPGSDVQVDIDYARQAGDFLKSARTQAREQLDQRSWPSWQLRAMRSCRKLLMTTQP